MPRDFQIGRMGKVGKAKAVLLIITQIATSDLDTVSGQASHQRGWRKPDWDPQQPRLEAAPELRLMEQWGLE
ncbi:hypothetical protein Pyrfu_1138 [Pyrolobus fumarii 1A]|uniref:Uncharacterized protein n=1 Tax=Pyrolobus fumarii (strain DSM 11204 / 1A) TaxID=694429 RepID=G0EFH9_PYRF1|nr:hypothetical protein Pyrfu_1138 [Pyrolobus fumarii 1A]